MKKFDVENWNRKAQFEFFKTYEDPFFNITTTLEVTKLYSFCKKYKLSFSLACIYVAIKCINEIQEFKLRFKNNTLYEFDIVHIGSTILNEDTSFSFCDFEFQPTIFEFISNAKKILEAHKTGVKFEVKENQLDIIHCSTVPWILFTSIKHARKGDEKSMGIPKIVFGKMFNENEIKKIPFSVEAHHAIMDGFHVSILLSKMQQYINELV